MFCSAEGDAPVFAERISHNVFQASLTDREVGADEPNGNETPMKNIDSDIPGDCPDELLQTVLRAESVRIERIVSHGHASPEGFWYDQEAAEWVAVLMAAARLRFDGDENAMDGWKYSQQPDTRDRSCTDAASNWRHRPFAALCSSVSASSSFMMQVSE